MTLVRLLALRAPVSPRITVVSPERAAASQRVAFALQVLLAARSGSPHSVALPLGAPRKPGSAITTQLAPRLPAAVIFVAASEVMMLGSGEFVMLLLRCCLLLMLWFWLRVVMEMFSSFLPMQWGQMSRHLGKYISREHFLLILVIHKFTQHVCLVLVNISQSLL